MSGELEAVDVAVRTFAAAVSGTSSVAEVDGIFATYARGRHFRVQLKVLKRAREDAEAAGLSPSAVPWKVLAPMLEHAGLEEEDDDDMISRWAHLLANAATASPAHVPPAFPEILRQLEPVDAQILEAVEQERHHTLGAARRDQGMTRFEVERMLGMEGNAIGQARIDNLVRLELLRPVSQRIDVELQIDEMSMGDRVMVTDLGLAFVDACRAPPQLP